MNYQVPGLEGYAFTRMEALMLLELIRAEGKGVEKADLYTAATGAKYWPYSAANAADVRSHIHNLRRKLGEKAWPLVGVFDGGYAWITDPGWHSEAAAARRREEIRRASVRTTVEDWPYVPSPSGGPFEPQYALTETWTWLLRMATWMQEQRPSHGVWVMRQRWEGRRAS